MRGPARNIWPMQLCLGWLRDCQTGVILIAPPRGRLILPGFCSCKVLGKKSTAVLFLFGDAGHRHNCRQSNRYYPWVVGNDQLHSQLGLTAELGSMSTEPPDYPSRAAGRRLGSDRG